MGSLFWQIKNMRFFGLFYNNGGVSFIDKNNCECFIDLKKWEGCFVKENNVCVCYMKNCVDFIVRWRSLFGKIKVIIIFGCNEIIERLLYYNKILSELSK